jgi:hypothetical protein
MAKSFLNPSLFYGLLSGAIIAITMIISMIIYNNNPEIEPSAVFGYTSMIVAFSLMFVGIKNYRDKSNGGTISFGKALKIGVLIALIGGTMYVVTWLIFYFGFIPDFMDRYIEIYLKQLADGGASAVELAAQAKEMAEFKEMYKNPLFVVLMTYAEVLPVGLVIALISALTLKRTQAPVA